MEPASTLVPVNEYLTAAYRPDCEYLEGWLLERHVGERDHSKVQMRLSAWLFNHSAKWGIHVFPEQRVQVRSDRFRVPDICVVAGPEPNEQIFTRPPLICIEVLSRDDPMTSMQERISDYLTLGVPNVWILDPRLKRAYVHGASGAHEVRSGELHVLDTAIAVPLDAVFE